MNTPPMITIGPHQHASRVIVAPMAGVTDAPFRAMCRDKGAHWLVSEMMTSDSKLWNTPKSRHRMRYHDEPSPRWVQIAGADPQMMAEAARFNADRGAEIIDINMGCPAKKVCKRAAGSALMRDEPLVARILEAVVGAVDIPVTLKTRLGWSRDEMNAVRIARIAEQSGIQLLTIHGRTRACKFEGQVDYQAIGEVVATVRIPVIANGDIQNGQQAQKVLDITGATGVMVGRAVQGNPWLVTEIDDVLAGKKLNKSPGSAEIKATLIAHIRNLAGFYGEVMGVRIARKHAGWSLGGKVSPEVMRQFNQLDSTEAQVEAIERAFAEDIAA